MMLFSFISLLSSFLANKHTGFRNINLALNSDFFFFFPLGNGQVPWQNKGKKISAIPPGQMRIQVHQD